MTNIPKCFSEALDLAIRDFKTTLADPRYTVEMRWWHEPLQDTCAVCFAGAVMAQTHCVHPLEDVSWDDQRFGYEWRPIFLALDKLRMGDVRWAADKWPAGSLLDDRDKADALCRNVKPYERLGPDGFIAAMEKLRDDLRAAGT